VQACCRPLLDAPTAQLSSASQGSCIPPRCLADLNLSTDPFTNNRYTFAAGNPTSMVDPTGHNPQPDNPVSANPKLNKWLTTEWEAPKRYEKMKAQSDFNDWFYETFRINRPNREWNSFCAYDWALCNYAAGKVFRGEWTAQQGLSYFEQTLRARSRNAQAFDEFLDMVANGTPPPIAEIGIVRAFGGLAGADDLVKATRELAIARSLARFDADFAIGQLTRARSAMLPVNASTHTETPVTRSSAGNHTAIEWDLP
jgi:hypothetical protein